MSADMIEGSCHCGAIRFAARVDLSDPTFRCNCSICTKSRLWLTTVQSTEFELRSGEELITEYRFGARTIVHCFCSRCGVKTHGRLDADAWNNRMTAINVACLDLTPEAFATVSIAYFDGRNDRFDAPPEHVDYL